MCQHTVSNWTTKTRPHLPHTYSKDLSLPYLFSVNFTQPATVRNHTHGCLVGVLHRSIYSSWNNTYRKSQSAPPPITVKLPVQWCIPRGAITERHNITFQIVFIRHSWLVELTSHPYPECWVFDNFQATSENSSLLSSLDFCFFLRKNTTPFALFP